MEPFEIKYVRINLRYKYLYYPIKNSMLKFMMSYMVVTSVLRIKHMAVMENFKKLSMVITTYLQTEIIVSIRKMIPK